MYSTKQRKNYQKAQVVNFNLEITTTPAKTECHSLTLSAKETYLYTHFLFSHFVRLCKFFVYLFVLTQRQILYMCKNYVSFLSITIVFRDRLLRFEFCPEDAVRLQYSKRRVKTSSIVTVVCVHHKNCQF